MLTELIFPILFEAGYGISRAGVVSFFLYRRSSRFLSSGTRMVKHTLLPSLLTPSRIGSPGYTRKVSSKLLIPPLSFCETKLSHSFRSERLTVRFSVRSHALICGSCSLTDKSVKKIQVTDLISHGRKCMVNQILVTRMFPAFPPADPA